MTDEGKPDADKILDESESPSPVKVGILFIHGIGQQKPGDTLIAFGQPLYQWVRDWVSGPRASFGARVRRCALMEPVLDAGDPAHLEFELTPTPSKSLREAGRSSRWTLAESCWGVEFRAPPFGKFALWMVGVGAWMVLSHFGKYIRVRLHAWRKLAFGPPLMLAAVVLALAVQLLVAALAVLAAIPIPRLRRGLSGLLRILTGTLGDSYVLISSPVQEAAAVARVRRDLDWLAARVDQVFVVAHSQGAAIAHRALRAKPPANVKRLLTFGSGLGKLEELRLLSDPAHRVFNLQVQIGLPLAAVALALLPRAVNAALEVSLLGLWNAWIVLIFLSPLILLGLVLKNTWSGWGAYLSRLKDELPLQDLEWHDCYSTADPVSNGPLGGAIASALTVESVPVRNLASVIGDHSAYWKNRDEFISWVMSRIDAVAETGLVAVASIDKQKPSSKRRFRVRMLGAMRSIAFASMVTAAAYLGLQGRLAPIAHRYLWAPLTELPELSWAGALAQAVAGAVAALVSLVTGASIDLLATIGLNLIAVLLIAAATSVSYLLTLAAWKWWDQVRMNQFFGAEYPIVVDYAPPAMMFFLGIAPAVFTTAVFFTPDLGSSLAIVGTVLGWYLQILAAIALFALVLPGLLVFGFWGTLYLLAAIGALGALVWNGLKWLWSRATAR